MSKIISAFLLSTIIITQPTFAQKNTKQDILLANIDKTVKPSEDFFLYANGGWIKRTPIPAAESGWGIGNLVQDDIYNKLKKINETAVKTKATKGSTTQKIGSFWRSGMNVKAIEKAGLTPLAVDLNKIDAITSADDVINVGSEFQTKGIGCLFVTYVAQDDKNSEEIAVQFAQGGLGLPNRDYYFNTDERTLKVKAAYKKYLLKTFINLRNATPQKDVEDLFALETAMANASRKLADLRDPYKNYNKMSMAQLNALAPNINWSLHTKIAGTNKVDSVIVGQPEFYTTLSSLLKNTAISVWKNYLKIKLVYASAPYLDTKTFNDRFEYRKTLTGASAPQVRWKRVLDSEEDAIGEALGQLFVKEYFNQTAKKRYDDIVENIRDAYKERITKLSWMGDDTKLKAYEKLASISKKVGFPDKWKDFSSLEVNDGPWVLNVQKANAWWHNYETNKLGKPVDRTEWSMTPQTYNAYYNPSNNEIVLPAGIFAVPGFKDAELDDALVYGYAAASTIGHEITHGFDDQGRQYDAKGNLTDWWSAKDGEEFSARAKMIIKQFNEFIPVDTLHINGEATQGENIADLGGILLGIDAFKKTEAYKQNKNIAGFTQMQRYFLGYALGWMYATRNETLANRVMTDVHSPAKERVNGPFVNVPEFYDAFGIKKGDKMYREENLRVNIW
ncbi:MAG: M13 family metallopeptidase [Ferruginibacter sp.]|nr:M13 family metallopeptidase [Ferruginibacter sp.]